MQGHKFHAYYDTSHFNKLEVGWKQTFRNPQVLSEHIYIGVARTECNTQIFSQTCGENYYCIVLYCIVLYCIFQYIMYIQCTSFKQGWRSTYIGGVCKSSGELFQIAQPITRIRL